MMALRLKWTFFSVLINQKGDAEARLVLRFRPRNENEGGQAYGKAI